MKSKPNSARKSALVVKDESKYSNYSLPMDIIGDINAISESIGVLEDYSTSETPIIESIILSNKNNGYDVGSSKNLLILQLTHLILEQGTVNTMGVHYCLTGPNTKIEHIPLLKEFVEEELKRQKNIDFEEYIEHGIIIQHVNWQATEIVRILQYGIGEHLSENIDKFDNAESYIKYLEELIDSDPDNTAEILEDHYWKMYMDQVYNIIRVEGERVKCYALIRQIRKLFILYKEEPLPIISGAIDQEENIPFYKNPDLLDNPVQKYLSLWQH